jgi:hypothetical protein
VLTLCNTKSEERYLGITILSINIFLVLNFCCIIETRAILSVQHLGNFLHNPQLRHPPIPLCRPLLSPLLQTLPSNSPGPLYSLLRQHTSIVILPNFHKHLHLFRKQYYISRNPPRILSHRLSIPKPFRTPPLVRRQRNRNLDHQRLNLRCLTH